MKKSAVRGIFTAVLMFLAVPGICTEDSSLFLQADLRHDVLDYDEDREVTFLRGRADYKAGKKFSLSYCEIRNLSTKERSRTASVFAEKIAGTFDFLAGNYNLNFGSGLIMGRRVYIPSDPFRSRLAVAKDRSLRPASGGNPAYSLFGFAGQFIGSSDHIEFSILPFFSIQKRYISHDDEDEGSVISSVNGLDSRALPDETHTVPVNVFNSGGLMSLDICRLLLIQAYAFRTYIEAEPGETILWDRGKCGSSEGTAGLQSAGFFMHYSDSGICIFFEPALCRRETEYGKNSYGAQWGINLHSSLAELKYTGKKTDSRFISPYSSGGRGPESIWNAAISLHPSSSFKIGADIYEDRDLAPSYNSSCIEGTRREGLFLSLRLSGMVKTDFKARRVSHYSDEYRDIRDQGTAALSVAGERIFVRLKYTVQDTRDEKLSHLFSWDFKYMFMENFSAAAGYTEVRISGDNRIYGSLPPSTGGTAAGKLFKDSGRAAAFKFRYRKGKDFASARMCFAWAGSEKERKFESALGLLF